MLAESWRRDGAVVEIARSTSEALRLLGGRAFGLIISDMGRRESDVDVPDAGLQLLTKVRATNPGVPFVLYGNVGPFGADARAAGATLMTDSTFELVEFASGLGMLDQV
jgi:DNA-binding NtrC family response regulator